MDPRGFGAAADEREYRANEDMVGSRHGSRHVIDDDLFNAFANNLLHQIRESSIISWRPLGQAIRNTAKFGRQAGKKAYFTRTKVVAGKKNSNNLRKST